MGYIFEELIRQFNEAIERKPRRALHAPRGHPADGEPADHRRPARLKQEAHHPHRLRSVLRHRAGCSPSPRSTSRRDQPQRRRPPVRPGGQPGDLRRLQVRPATSRAATGGMPTTSSSAARSRNDHTPATASTTCSPIRPTARIGRWTRRRSRRKPSGATPVGSVPGLPRISDGQLLFLQHMLSRMKDAEGGRQPRRHRDEWLAPVHRAMRAAARAKSAAGFWRTTGWKPSSPCRSSCSTTRASPPTSGF